LPGIVEILSEKIQPVLSYASSSVNRVLPFGMKPRPNPEVAAIGILRGRKKNVKTNAKDQIKRSLHEMKGTIKEAASAVECQSATVEQDRDTVEVWGSSPHASQCPRKVQKARNLQCYPEKSALYLRSVCVPNGVLEA
jgi:hypothetical protein